jgi:hypothetical protein
MDGTEIGEVLGVGESEVVEKVATGGGKTVEQRVHSTFWGGKRRQPANDATANGTHSLRPVDGGFTRKLT